MADFDNATAFASYSTFSVGGDSVNPEEDGYALKVEGYSGTAGTLTCLTSEGGGILRDRRYANLSHL